jgi:hypothetical protein
MSSIKNIIQCKLTRLESNKKVLIMDLTEVAKANILHAAEIADAIQEHIIEVCKIQIYF